MVTVKKSFYEKTMRNEYEKSPKVKPGFKTLYNLSAQQKKGAEKLF